MERPNIIVLSKKTILASPSEVHCADILSRGLKRTERCPQRQTVMFCLSALPSHSGRVEALPPPGPNPVPHPPALGGLLEELLVHLLCHIYSCAIQRLLLFLSAPSPGGFRNRFGLSSHMALCSSVPFLFLHFPRRLLSPRVYKP